MFVQWWRSAAIQLLGSKKYRHSNWFIIKHLNLVNFAIFLVFNLRGISRVNTRQIGVQCLVLIAIWIHIQHDITPVLVYADLWCLARTHNFDRKKPLYIYLIILFLILHLLLEGLGETSSEVCSKTMSSGAHFNWFIIERPKAALQLSLKSCRQLQLPPDKNL